MTMMNGLETGDLDIMDEEFLGPPPRFLLEGSGADHDRDATIDSEKDASLFPGIAKIRRLLGAW